MMGLFYKGNELSFYVYSESSDSIPVLKFFDKLKKKRPKDYEKVMDLIKRYSDFAKGLYRNEQKFKNVEGKICEIKSHQVRIWCIRKGKSILILLGGYLKKDQKTPKRELEKIRKLVQQLENEGTV